MQVKTDMGRRAGERKPAVWVSREALVLPTYLPAAPDKNPMFLERRVYQGSSGRVYPLPFTDRIAEEPADRTWRAIRIGNEYLEVLILPELGGRIHAILDKTNGYDLIYRQEVIKPALVGLAGPWISGGIEFNWPQHHRPATFLPVDVSVEDHPDGSKTVWCSDHDPMARMKGMHGVCVRPGRAWVELKVRVYNRTPLTQTFLWWANVATRVHESYQSFFPPDVSCVADHARRSMSAYPRATGIYYGVNYGRRGRRGVPRSEVPQKYEPPQTGGASPVNYPPNDLSFYANIPTPCSYMAMGSRQDFFGGYDHAARAGLIHVANHHISPGKKQWTWGNHEFGYAWDRNLTDPDAQGEFAPYIEIMAGVYTDNQPDFSFLRPGETKVWSQYWYPIQEIGPAQHANVDAAVSLQIIGRRLRLGVVVTRIWERARLRLLAGDRALLTMRRRLAPGHPLIVEVPWRRAVEESDLQLLVTDADGHEILTYRPGIAARGSVAPAATEPPAPPDIASADELYVTGVHLEQYRHATRCPTDYWREALRRDPGDARCHNALGLWHYKRGEFARAEHHFRAGLARVTRWNANPPDGEPFYHLGLALRQMGRDDEAVDAFYKATWNQAWAGAGHQALAELAGQAGRWSEALEHLERVLRLDADHLGARDLKVVALRKLGRAAAGDRLLQETLALDPLDWWARHLNGETVQGDLQVRLDLAHDWARAGLLEEAVRLLRGARSRPRDLPDQSWGAAPMVQYTLGWLEQKRGHAQAAARHFRKASRLPPDYCFPARLEDIAILEAAMRVDPRDARAPYYLGNLLFDRRRHAEAIALWERSARLDGTFSVVWRNLGIGYFNHQNDGRRARVAYDRAVGANPGDARLLYERDQLWRRLGVAPEERLRALEVRPDLVRRRDDLCVELSALYNQTGRPDRALALIRSRSFQPWEGGEGGPLGQWVRSHLALGRAALRSGDPATAREHVAAALVAPATLGEARHLLANQSDVNYWLGCALAAGGKAREARRHWRAAATFEGDFQEMSVRAFSEMTYYTAMARRELGQKKESRAILRALLAYAQKLQKAIARIDYFATSLPAMLLFHDDLQYRQETTALFLQAQARLGLGQRRMARPLLRSVLRRDPNHALAAELFHDVA